MLHANATVNTTRLVVACFITDLLFNRAPLDVRNMMDESSNTSKRRFASIIVSIHLTDSTRGVSTDLHSPESCAVISVCTPDLPYSSYYHACQSTNCTT